MRRSAPAPSRFPALVIWFSLLLAAGCASIKVNDQQTYEGPRLSRPDRIIVVDFAATPADLPRWSDAASRFADPSPPRSAQEIEVGRKLGAQIAEELVQEIQGMGLPGVRAVGQPPPRIDDIVIVGYLASIDEGSAAKRVALGFGSGAAELTTEVEGYLMTDQGLRKLGSGQTTSGAGKTPGVLVPLAVTVATANPIGLVVGTAVKGGEELAGKSTIEGVAKNTATTIAEKLQAAFERQGWI